MAFGLVDRFAVIGSESGLRAVIETALGGGALAHASGYSKLLAVAPSNALAHIYSNPASSTPTAKPEGISGLLQALTGAREANISVVPSASSLSIDADTLASGSAGEAGGLLAADPQAAQALGELPGESWLAIGLGHVGATLSQDAQDLQALASLGSTLGGGPPESSAGLSISGLLQGLITPLRELGADSAQARRDFASWMGSAGIFASGSSLLELKGGGGDRLQEPGALPRGGRRARRTAAQGGRLGRTGVDPRHRRGSRRTAERPAGRARHRRRTRLGTARRSSCSASAKLRWRPP